MSNSKHLVVLSGAGMSAESGIRTFRDTGGLWEEYDIYEVATPEAFARDPELVLRFYNMRRKAARDVAPNTGHKVIAELERDFTVTVITQNIDDLHERAGSTHVHHLHGEILKARSVTTGKLYDCPGDINLGDLCPDGGQLRPHVVWFGEPVPAIEEAARICATADYFAVIGTSLQVYPAAGLIHYVPSEVPKYIIDPDLERVPLEENLTYIQQPATTGVIELQRLLQETPYG